MPYDDEPRADRPDSHEGIFDAQLSLPGAFAAPVAPIETIIKRDGHEEPFDKTKIARAILAAGEAEGGYDEARAASLARAVAIYLSKRTARTTVTVDEIHAAVERVLMHMGHYRTATAFARYREKRDRVRALRERRHPVYTTDVKTAEALVQIQTSDEALAAWDRSRIVSALVRETGIGEAEAKKVASQVEAQIVSAKVRTLTTTLVRELVTAKLIELGYEDYAQRHRRLGVPLFDTESILCGSVMQPVPQSRDPETTDWMLAESVKREYALNHVYSSDVAEAHLSGDIHIHGLSMIDRLHSARHSLELIKRFGMDILGVGSVAGPPRALDVLSAEWSGVTMALQRHFYGPMVWRAANVFAAPFLEGMPEKELHAWAEMTVRDLAMGSAVSARPMPPVGIELCWDVPQSLVETEAVGPGCVFTNRAYGEYEYTCQKAANAMVHAFRELRRRGITLASPIPIIRISPALFRDPGYHEILIEIAALAASNSRIEVVFDRSEPWLVGEDMPWRSRDVSLHCVTLNLPRAAYRGGADGIAMELERVMPIAAAAHAQKFGLLSRILDQGEAGPLALVGRMREGAAIHALEQAVCQVSLVGLHECVEHCTGEALHESAEAQAVALEIVRVVKALCAFWSEQTGLTLTLTATDDRVAAGRLAGLDADQFAGPAAGVIKTDAQSQDWSYTPGVQIPGAAALTPAERVRLEGALHNELSHLPATRISIPDHDMSPQAVAAFLLKAFRQTTVQRLVFG